MAGVILVIVALTICTMIGFWFSRPGNASGLGPGSKITCKVLHEKFSR